MKILYQSKILLSLLLLVLITSTDAFGMDACKTVKLTLMGEAKEGEQYSVDDISSPFYEQFCRVLRHNGMSSELISIIHNYVHCDGVKLIPFLPPTNKRLQDELYILLDPMPLDLIKIILAYRGAEIKGEKVACVDDKYRNEHKNLERLLELSDGHIASVSRGKYVNEIWDSKGDYIKKNEQMCYGCYGQLSSDELVLANHENIELWNYQNGHVDNVYKCAPSCTSVMYRAIVCAIPWADNIIVTGMENGEIKMWDTRKHVCCTCINSWPADIKTEGTIWFPIIILTKISDDILAAGVSGSMFGWPKPLCEFDRGERKVEIKFWNWKTGRQYGKAIKPHFFSLSSLLLLSEKIVASADDSCEIKLWYWQTGACLTKIVLGYRMVRSIAVVPDSGLLAIGGDDGFVRFCDPITGDVVQKFQAYKNKRVTALLPLIGKRHDNGGTFVTSSSDGAIKFWQ